MKSPNLIVVLAFLVYMLGLSACDTLKDIARTADDLGNLACEVFGTDHPAEFEQLVRSVLPPGAPALESAHADGFNPRVLCDIKEVVQPFIDDQLRLQQSTAASLQRPPD